jgi:hypothetical protein
MNRLGPEESPGAPSSNLRTPYLRFVMTVANRGRERGVKAAEMTNALVQINDQLALAAGASGFEAMVFHCECGECLAEDVRLSIEEHDEIRAREDLIFAPDHGIPRSRRSAPA